VEIWKDIPSYEGLYQISNLGNVKSLYRIANNNHIIYEKILKPQKNYNGYLIVNLYKNNRMKAKLIHRLVGKTFVDNPNNYNYINQIDKNKSNNNANNLEWCTQSYNVIYSKGRKINQYDKNNNFIKTWNSIADIKRTLNIDNGSIVRCCKGIKKSAGGFKWEYNN
jgi:hypothetical protein